MNRFICLLFVIVIAVGCKTPRPPAVATPDTDASVATPPADPAPPISTPHITMVHVEQKFVVIDFSRQAMPPIGKRLRAYRDGQPQGEVQITEPVRARFATADILSGEMRVGDEVR